jgi:transposase-like protein
MFLSADCDDNFIQMPIVSTLWGSPPEAIGIFSPEFLGPLPHRFMADLNAAGSKHFLNHTQAQRKPIIEPNRMGDHFGRKTMATVKDISWHDHRHKIPNTNSALVKLTVPLEAVRLVPDRGVSVAQAARDLDLHENVLRRWINELGADAGHAFPDHGQMKPEQLELDRLRKEMSRLNVLLCIITLRFHVQHPNLVSSEPAAAQAACIHTGTGEAWP